MSKSKKAAAATPGLDGPAINIGISAADRAAISGGLSRLLADTLPKLPGTRRRPAGTSAGRHSAPGRCGRG